jgi:hypothetical protein
VGVAKQCNLVANIVVDVLQGNMMFESRAASAARPSCIMMLRMI